MDCLFKELADLRVIINDVQYAPHLEAPEDRPFPFAYFITIDNQSDETVTIKGRKWIVSDVMGQTLVVEGEGVVGKFPRLAPGETFTYSSYHVIHSDSVAEGAFLGITDSGVPVVTRIPQFQMRVP